MPSHSVPLHPRYPDPEQFGCPGCRDAFGPDHFDDRAVPPPFVPVSQRLGRRLPAWTRPFHACRECDSIWMLVYSPGELTYQQVRTPLGMTRALRPEATLDEIMVPLFAPAPVGSAAEQALWQRDDEPQELWDRLVSAWRHPGVEVARKAIILRQLGRLLRPENPRHRTLMRQRGWLLTDLRGFDDDLAGLEEEVAREGGPWWGFPDASKDLATLRDRMKADGVLPREVGESPEPEPTPPREILQPAGLTLSGQPLSAAADETPIPHSLAERTLSLLKPWWNYLPAVVLGWVLVEAVGHGMPTGERWLAQGVFFCFVVIAGGAGATVSAGISEVGLWRTFLHRLSVMGELLYMGILGFLAALIYLAVAAMFDSELSHPGHPFGMAAAALLPLTRFWPFWMIPFMQPVEHDIKMMKSMGNYRWPAMATAWRMTREPGTFRRRTLPWFLALAAALAVTALATEWGGTVGRSVVLYPVVHPLFTAFTWALIEPMPTRHPE